MLRTISQLSVVPIAAVRDERASVLAASFSAEEAHRLTDAPAQTVAGLLALKRAVAELLGSDERAIELDHDERGAPVLLGPRAERLVVSISHTRSHAYGLAVVERGNDDD